MRRHFFTLIALCTIHFVLCEKAAAGDAPDHVTAKAVKIEFTLVPAGKFLMGCPLPLELFRKAAGHEPGIIDGFPRHEVELDAFYLGTTEVTVGQWRSFAHDSKYRTTAERSNSKYYWNRPEFKQTDAHPVIYVSYEDALAYAEWLSKRDRILYRLPTEAEWEYACRAGSTSTFPWGDSADEAWRFANLKSENDRFKFTSPVKSFTGNAWGLYDMIGNVHEWCSDWCSAEYYLRSPSRNPVGPDNGDARCYRGGSWEDAGAWSPHSRNPQPPNVFYRNGGFRLARDVVITRETWTLATKTRWEHLTRRKLALVGHTQSDVVVGQVRWKVLSARDLGNRLDSRVRGTAKTTPGRFIRADLEVENLGREPTTFLSRDLFDDQGRRFDAIPDAAMYLDDKSIFILERINPNLPMSFTQVYEVPRNSHDFVVEVSNLGIQDRMEAAIELGF